MDYQTSIEQEQKWAEEIKYYAARSIWHKRTKKAPIGPGTWGVWFERKFGEPYMEYVERMKRQKAE